LHVKCTFDGSCHFLHAKAVYKAVARVVYLGEIYNMNVVKM